MKIPFTIEDAKAALIYKMGRIVTREGYAVEILDFNFEERKNEHFRVRGKFRNFTACWDKDGKFYIRPRPSEYINISRLDLEIEIDDSL